MKKISVVIFLMLPRATRFLTTVSIQLLCFFLYKIFTFSECAFQGSKAQLDLTLAVILGPLLKLSSTAIKLNAGQVITSYCDYVEL